MKQKTIFGSSKRIIAFACFAILLSVTGMAQKKISTSSVDTLFYFYYENAPRLEKILPGPPSLTSPRFYYDWSQYREGLSVRDTPRGDTARADASYTAAYMMKRFGAVMGQELTPESHPQMYQLLNSLHGAERTTVASAKFYYKRKRPYQQFKEPSGYPKDERKTDFTSYPSGHTTSAWLMGMTMSAIDPAHLEPIMKVAYDMGQSRVILGFHYQSDVDEGRLAGSITFARLCAIPSFLKQLKKVQEEFKKKSVKQ